VKATKRDGRGIVVGGKKEGDDAVRVRSAPYGLVCVV